jgi:hypothetical protein
MKLTSMDVYVIFWIVQSLKKTKAIVKICNVTSYPIYFEKQV